MSFRPEKRGKKLFSNGRQLGQTKWKKESFFLIIFVSLLMCTWQDNEGPTAELCRSSSNTRFRVFLSVVGLHTFISGDYALGFVCVWMKVRVWKDFDRRSSIHSFKEWKKKIRNNFLKDWRSDNIWTNKIPNSFLSNLYKINNKK